MRGTTNAPMRCTARALLAALALVASVSAAALDHASVQETQSALQSERPFALGVHDPIDVVFLVTGPDGQRVDNARRLARHLVREGEAPVRFHLVTDQPRASVAEWATLHLLSSMSAEGLALHANFSKITHGPGSIYMWKPLLQWLLPQPRVLVLDADVLLVRSVHELWAEFDRFGADTAVGMAREQAPSYEKLKPEAGVNGGVQLLNLERMRDPSSLYQHELRRCATGACGDIGYLGDQTLYSIMKDRTPGLFHTLPCGWNRQLSIHFWAHKEFRSRHACPTSCGLVHGNQPKFKNMIRDMQAAGRAPQCDECRRGLAELLGPSNKDASLQYSAKTVLDCCCAGSR